MENSAEEILPAFTRRRCGLPYACFLHLL
jgi:hypothetical protein